MKTKTGSLAPLLYLRIAVPNMSAVSRRKSVPDTDKVQSLVFQVLIRLGFLDRDPKVASFEEKMLKNIGPESLTAAFKHWQNLAVGAVLMAFSAYVTISARDIVTTTSTQLQGWAMLIIAGYVFASALFLGLSTLSEHSSLPQSLPGIVDNFKIFIVAGISYAIGYFLLNIETSALPTSQSLSQALSFLIGGTFFLVAIVIAVTAAFREPTKKLS